MLAALARVLTTEQLILVAEAMEALRALTLTSEQLIAVELLIAPTGTGLIASIATETTVVLEILAGLALVRTTEHVTAQEAFIDTLRARVLTTAQLTVVALDILTDLDLTLTKEQDTVVAL